MKGLYCSLLNSLFSVRLAALNSCVFNSFCLDATENAYRTLTNANRQIAGEFIYLDK